MDEFVARAQTILQRRKARSGNSLELQLREILHEEGFVEGATFSHQPESDRVKTKHLLTLQEGVSVNQFKEMVDANVRLVVPVGLHGSYPASIRPALISLDTFLGEMKKLS